VNRTLAPGDNVSDDEKKAPPKKDRDAEARDEARQRQWRSIQSGARAIVSEMKRVTWPTRDEWVSATVVTIGIVVLVALWTTAIGQLAEWIFGTGK
jgi:preprotein translocase SecE subunit